MISIYTGESRRKMNAAAYDFTTERWLRADLACNMTCIKFSTEIGRWYCILFVEPVYWSLQQDPNAKINQ